MARGGALRGIFGEMLEKLLRRAAGRNIGVSLPSAQPGLHTLLKDGNCPASRLERYCLDQGWTRSRVSHGPIKYVDGNGIDRMTLKSGSARTRGSETPHVALRDESGRRVDAEGNPVSRRSPGNHTEITWDLE